MPEPMYHELAEWWPLLSRPEDYEEEAGFYTELLQGACDPKTVLELGSGGGNNASYMERYFSLTLVDRSPGMLAVSRKLNPECEHVQGDMRDVRLGREFDAVFIHDAVVYMATRDDLLRALVTARTHVKPGGAVLISPDCTTETYQDGTERGGYDAHGRGMRYLEWHHDDDPNDEQYTTDYAFLLKEGADVRAVHDRHTCGLFSEATWLELCAQAGIPGKCVTVTHTGVGEAPVFLCKRG